jgi:polyhydroxybutyrate depolymerase
MIFSSQWKTAMRGAFLGSNACAAPAAPVVSGTLQRPEGPRHYLAALPEPNALADSSTTGRLPLVIVLHGAGASAAQVLGMAFPPSPLSVWLQIAARERVIVVAADAGKGGWSDCFASDKRVAKKDDVAFIGALIDHAVARHGADPERVYVVGVSRGGLMAYRIAAEIPHRLAAFSSLLACMPPTGRAAAPTRALPALIVGCTADPFMPYAGGKFFKTLGFMKPVRSIDDSVRVWRELAGLRDAHSVTELPRNPASGRTRATRYIWGDKPDGMQVGLYRIEHGGHAEPSRTKRYPGFINRLTGLQNADFEVAEAVWEFFRPKRARRSPPL